MIKIKNLTKIYDKQKVLDDVGLEIKAGKLTTLLGQNGSGKSTLLNMLSGYELPTEGSVEYKGESLSSINFSHKHDICFIHEKIDYIVPLKMSEYVDLLKVEIPNWDQAFFEKMVVDRKFDLNKNFQEYSRGQKMQVCLMIGLASNVPVLLLDEITSVIDVYGRKYFLDLLYQYVSKGNTVVITTNIINELEFYTDNLVIIKDSHIVLNQAVEDISKHFFKIRQPVGFQHEIFNDPKCVWAGVNSDKSVSYIVSNEALNKYQITDEMKDRRKSSLEDIFIFYFSEVDTDHENAA
jgi:ABC-2 type transport system ATP-binding protein